MSSQTLGKPISDIEVTNISTHGIWMIVRNEEHFLSYEDFPWFKDAPVRKILNVQEPSPNHFHWPDLDIDISLDIINNPETFPLKAK